MRLAWIQFFKRSPANFRKPARVPKGYNPKGLALFVSGLVSVSKYDEAKILIDLLRNLVSPGYKDSCWGYNFDWQARGFLTPKGMPNLVTTVFVVNSLLDFYDATGDRECLKLSQSGCNFFLQNLILYEDRNNLCFGYMPGAEGRVHNVNMLGASTLARLFRITGDEQLLEKSRKAMRYTINALRKDYSWVYAEGKFYQFIDNFHTGFNLVSLCNWMEYTGEYLWMRELKSAYDYFLKTFWMDNGCPKYYHNSLHPIDIHCSAQGIITVLKLSNYYDNAIELAEKIADWAIDNMQDKSGYFYYQKTKWYTNRIPYMRWSQAWMFYSLSLLNKEYAA